MNAFILAAGRGERLRPLSDTTPKPLVDVNGKAIIEYHLDRLARLGFKRVVINIAHLGFKIKEHLGDGSRYNLSIYYSDEQHSGALESGGGIIKALALIKSDTFLVVNGDIMCDYEFDIDFKLDSTIKAHIILVPNPPHNPLGDFGLNNNLATNERVYTFSGIGYYKKELFSSFAVQKMSLAPLLREAIAKKDVSSSLYEGRWIDVGTMQRLAEARAIFV